MFCWNCVAYTTLSHSFLHAMPGAVDGGGGGGAFSKPKPPEFGKN